MSECKNSKCVNGGDVFKLFGKFGRFHKLQYFLVCLPLLVFSMTIANYVFVAEDVNYRCRVPECENEESSVDKPTWLPLHTDGKCSRPRINLETFKKNNETCTNSTFLDEWTECHEWIYENNNSIVAELNLGCQPWKSMLVGSVRNSAMIASMLPVGWLSDKIGRKPTVIMCSVGGSIGVIKIFLSNYYVYLAVEFLESFLSSGLLTVCVVLLIEIGGEPKRVMAGVIFSYACYVGEFIFAFLAMGLQYWKHLILAINTPCFLFIFYIGCLRESTRWQLLRGKTEEAKDTFKSLALCNKLNISTKEIEDITDEELRTKLNVQIQKEKESVREIVRSKEIMIRLLVTSFCFFTSGFIYCGMLVHSVLLPGNKYVNFALGAIASFPGDLLAYYTFNKFGRKITLQCGYFASAIFIVAQGLTPDYISWLKLLLFLFGKFGAVVCFTGVYTYSLELFPTSVRGSLVGCGNTAARVGSMLAPLTPLLTTELAALPSILFSTAAAIAGLLLTFTPETRTLPMFDTIAQVDDNRRAKSTSEL